MPATDPTPEHDDDDAPPPALPVVAYRTAGAQAREGTRPGWLTALGVLSVVIGVAGVVAHLAAVRTVADMFRLTTPPPRPFTPPPLRPSPPLNPYAGEWLVPGGMGRADREAMVEHLTLRMSLGVARRESLRRLLGNAGGQIFGGSSDAVTEAGQLPAGPDGPNALGTHFFRTPNGTVLIDDNVARFYPGDADPPIRVEQGRIVRPTGLRVAGRMIWSGTDGAREQVRVAAVVIEETLDDLRRQHGPAFTATQAAALGQRMASAAPYDPVFAAFAGAPATPLQTQILDGGTFEYVAAGTRTLVLRTGWVIENASPLLDPRTGQRFRPGLTPIRLPLTRAHAVLSAAYLVLGAALATFLATCGLLTLTDAPAAARYHARWAWLKLWLMLAFLIPVFSTTTAMALQRAGNQSPIIVATVIVTAGVLVAQLGYPLAVLAVLRSRDVWAFYAARNESVTALRDQTRAAWRRRTGVFATTRRGRSATAACLAVLVLAMVVYAADALNERTDTTAWYAQGVFEITLFGTATAATAICAVALLRHRYAHSRAAVAALIVLAVALPARGQTTRRPATRATAAENAAVAEAFEKLGAGDAAADRLAILSTGGRRISEYSRPTRELLERKIPKVLDAIAALPEDAAADRAELARALPTFASRTAYATSVRARIEAAQAVTYRDYLNFVTMMSGWMDVRKDQPAHALLFRLAAHGDERTLDAIAGVIRVRGNEPFQFQRAAQSRDAEERRGLIVILARRSNYPVTLQLVESLSAMPEAGTDPAVRRLVGVAVARLGPQALGRMAEEGVVGRRSDARWKLEAAAFAADGPSRREVERQSLARDRERHAMLDWSDGSRSEKLKTSWSDPSLRARLRAAAAPAVAGIALTVSIAVLFVIAVHIACRPPRQFHHPEDAT
jgi:hypothetical protein